MAKQTFPLDNLLGPIVNVTIGLSVSDEMDIVLNKGIPPDPFPTYAMLSPVDSITLVSKELVEKLQPTTTGFLNSYIPTLPRENRRHYPLLITIDSYTKSWLVYAAEIDMPGPVMCILGRDVLSEGIFTYEGPLEEIQLDFPES